MSDFVPFPKNSLRHRISKFILENKDALVGKEVLEIGSYLPNDKAYWASGRDLYGENSISWTGADYREGVNVDIVLDIENEFLPRWFDTVIAIETIEHIYHIKEALTNMWNMVKPKGSIILTTVFAHPVHGHPHDYWRFTPQCLNNLLSDAGFEDIIIKTDGYISTEIIQYNPDNPEIFSMPIHVFARATKPEVLA